jgi:hypothetical protein
MDVLLIIFGFSGITLVINYSKYSLRFQNYLNQKSSIISHWLSDLLHCPFCLGFWVGVGEGFLFIYYEIIKLPAGIIILGLAGVNSLISAILAKHLFEVKL